MFLQTYSKGVYDFLLLLPYNIMELLQHLNMDLQAPESVLPGQGHSYLAPEQTVSCSFWRKNSVFVSRTPISSKLTCIYINGGFPGKPLGCHKAGIGTFSNVLLPPRPRGLKAELIWWIILISHHLCNNPKGGSSENLLCIETQRWQESGTLREGMKALSPLLHVLH